MSLTAASVWEIRTTGSDANGGCYDPSFGGTDYSQQNAAQLSVTDAVTNGTTTVTSATGGFVSAMLGNGINIAGNVYQITAVGSSTSITIDRTATAGSGQTAKVGGACASPGYVAGQKAMGNTVFAKAGTYSITSASQNISGGCIKDQNTSDSVWSKWIGYNTTRSYPCADTTRPLFQLAVAVSSATIVTTEFVELHNINVDGNSQTSSQGVNLGFASIIDQCKVSNCSNYGINITGTQGAIFNCEVTGVTGGSGIYGANGSGALVASCYVHDNTVTGISAIQYVFGCIAANNTGASSDGINQGGSAPTVAIGCTCYGNSRDGYSMGGFARGVNVQNSLSYGNGQYGFNCSGANVGLLLNCAGGSNTSGNVNGSKVSTSGFVTLSANPFNNSASGDYSLNNTAGGGAACRAAGFPGVFPGATTRGYLDIGAAQHQDSGGGSGGVSRARVVNGA